MKNFLSLVVLLTMSSASFAQLEIGVDGAFNTTWFINNNVSDQGPNLNPNASFGGSGGITGSFFITKSLGIGAEINFNSVNQKYDGTLNSVNYNGQDHANYVQVPILFKLKTQGGFYIELGPEWNFLTSASGDLTSDPANSVTDYSGRDIKNGFASSVLGLVFGFGARVPLTEHLVFTGGLRFFGGLTDATVEYTPAEFTAHLAAGDIGIADTYAHLDQQQNYSYEKTSLVTGGVQLGLLYAIGKKQKSDSK